MNCIRLFKHAGKHTFCMYNMSAARYISQHPIRFLETQNMWRERDGVSKQWQLIYKAPMGTVLNVASAYLTLTTGVVGASGLYYAAFAYNPADLDKPVIIGDDIVIANSALEGLIYLGAFIALHVAVKLVLSKYVIRLYQDGDNYMAIYRGSLYNSIKKHKFHLKDFKKLNPNVVVPWSESRYSLGNKQGILFENYFKTPEYFNYLLTKDSKDRAEEE